MLLLDMQQIDKKNTEQTKMKQLFRKSKVEKYKTKPNQTKTCLC